MPSVANYPQDIHNNAAPLPTPPFSPPAMDPFLSTVNLLDSLVAFYHQERMWVYRTRASLELAYDGPLPCVQGSSEELPSIDEEEPTPVVKTEELITPPLASTLWARRKKNFKLKLNGISTRGTRRPAPDDAQSASSGVQMLELFESMMEARMESCERVNKLIRNANRADLRSR